MRRSACAARAIDLRNLPLHGYTQNQIWCEIVALACGLIAWMQILALARPQPAAGTQAPAIADIQPLPDD
jgi:hypothetical protein